MFEYLKNHPRVRRWIAFAERYERHIGVGALLFGFVFDTLTLSRPDQLFGNLILSGYLLASAATILFLVVLSRMKREEVPPVLPLILLQFCFGNLAGGLLVLYGQSGTFEGSLLFFVVLGAFILANETLRQRYARLNFNISAWFFLLLAYAALIVPVIVGRLGTLVFLGSGLVTLVLLAGFLVLLYKLSPESFQGMKRKLGLYLGSILVLWNALYFFNIIPPVPLSLQSMGIYHSVFRTSAGDYQATYERPRWYEVFRSTHRTFNFESGDTAYCFSAVFAPGGLSTPVRHRWEYLDPDTGKWRTMSLLSFSIQGGRDSGFRGYSESRNLRAGKWRCSVETVRGATIGRTTFLMKESVPVRLVTENI